jgi:hypothetical protein
VNVGKKRGGWGFPLFSIDPLLLFLFPSNFVVRIKASGARDDVRTFLVAGFSCGGMKDRSDAWFNGRGEGRGNGVVGSDRSSEKVKKKRDGARVVQKKVRVQGSSVCVVVVLNFLISK